MPMNRGIWVRGMCCCCGHDLAFTGLANTCIVDFAAAAAAAVFVDVGVGVGVIVVPSVVVVFSSFCCSYC
jgi:hypothetical protein